MGSLDLTLVALEMLVTKKQIQEAPIDPSIWDATEVEVGNAIQKPGPELDRYVVVASRCKSKGMAMSETSTII